MMEMMEMTREELTAIKNNDKADVRDHLAARALLRAMSDNFANQDLNTVMDRTEGGVDRTLHLTAGKEPGMSLEDATEMVRQAGLAGPGGVGEAAPRIEGPDEF